jgi:ceramide glucosyltransferase
MTLPSIFLALAAFGLLFFAMGVLALAMHVRKRPGAAPMELPPVSILKPLKGTEEHLEENLETFFVQDYAGPLEIVFSSTEDDDPALVVARKVAARHPEIAVRFALSDPDFGLNPKVANLRGALRIAQYDLVLQSDANVRAQPNYLSRVVAELEGGQAQLLSSLVVGVGEASAGGVLENLQLGAMIVPACCFALTYFGVPCVIGKSMLFRRSELAAIGGLESVRDVLAEDYLLGRAFQAAGKKVILSSTVAENVNGDVSVDRFMSRHARWLKMRAVIHVPAFIADVFANPVPFALAAAISSVVVSIEHGELDLFVPALALGIVLGKTQLDRIALRITRGTDMGLRGVLLGPIKDLLLLSLWPYAAISRSVEWRGTKLRLGWGTKLRRDEGNLLARVRRRASA